MNVHQTPARVAIRRRQPFLAAFVTAVLLGISLPSGAADVAQGGYDQAITAFRAGRTSEAFGQFQELANHGDVDAARIALFMISYGPSLYGKQWDALPVQLDRWNRLVQASGTAARPIPGFEPAIVWDAKGAEVAKASR